MKTYRRQLGFLVIFGLIRGLIWSGDILLLYGAVGLIFVYFRNLSHTRLFVFAVFMPFK